MGMIEGWKVQERIYIYIRIDTHVRGRFKELCTVCLYCSISGQEKINYRVQGRSGSRGGKADFECTKLGFCILEAVCLLLPSMYFPVRVSFFSVSLLNTYSLPLLLY